MPVTCACLRREVESSSVELAYVFRMRNLEEDLPVSLEKRRELSSFLLCIRENSPEFSWRREFSSPSSPRRNDHITSFSPSFLPKN